ncbi:MAG: rod shape-determining protein MreC [Pseudomonadota bacterium]
MAQDQGADTLYVRTLRRILVGLLVLVLLTIFLFWRIDGPRAEHARMAVIDSVVPRLAWMMAPVRAVSDMARDFQSYAQLYEQNQQLRRELQQMKAWKEAASQLEQKNAQLMDLNNLRLDPKLTHIGGVVLADSGSPFRQSVLVNIGSRDGVRDGWAAMDGIGLVGRISGVARNSARVVLLTDSNSSVPVLIEPSGQKALLKGDDTVAPSIAFLETVDLVQPGDRVVTSGAGGVLPPGLLVGHLAQTPDGRLRVRLAADYSRLRYLRVLRKPDLEQINDPGGMVTPDALLSGVQSFDLLQVPDG